MTFGFLSGLFGCRQPVDHGSWTSLVVSNLSPDRRDSYSFRVNAAESGEMVLFGYCFDDEKEYRSDEGLVLTAYTADILRNMEIEKLAVYSKKRKSRSLGAVDTVERIAQITCEDGNDFSILLSNEQRAAIVSRLGGEMMAAVNAELHGAWEKLYYSRSGGDDFSNYFSISLERSADGGWIVSGSCPDSDGVHRDSEDGFAAAEDTLEKIRAMQLERYAAEMPIKEEFSDEIILLDGETTTLTLVFADGYLENKNVPAAVMQELLLLMRREFETNT